MTAMPKLDAFLRWVAKAPRGKTYTYHIGSLMYDRERAVNPQYHETHAIGEAAYAAYEAGHIALTQRKLDQFRFEYRATAR